MAYMTRQQQAVLKCIESCPGGRATAMDLMQMLRQEGQTVGLSTVYRQLEKLVAQGKVHKLLTEEGACYQYCDKTVHRDCFLLQCESCGAIFHMDCSHLGELYGHLLESHGFAINPRRTMFYGLCGKCREAER
ncbi:MAG: transcriptional repressor [Clostridiales bacterium]|nr:transcriptional repressor [Clostridiales bacterium]